MNRVTIITVVYNGENSIKNTIESVLEQTVAPYEYLIIDGASKDRTVDIAKGYEKEFEKKNIIYKIYSEKDEGIYDAMNKGVKKATGDFIVFLNSDDWYDPKAIEIFKNQYEKEEFDFAYGSIQYMNNNGELLVKCSRMDWIVSSRNWNHPSSFVRKSLYLENPFDLSFDVYADMDWYLKIRKMDNVKIKILPKDAIISHFKLGGASINSDIRQSLKRAEEKYRAYKKNGYNRAYFIEAYGWEFVKYMFAVCFG